MTFRFRIPYDDKMKLIPILSKFNKTPFTRATVVSCEDMPNITSGDITRWEESSIVKRLGRVDEFIETVKRNHDGKVPPNINFTPVTGNPYVWVITDRAITALTKKPRGASKGDS